jgi:hypothetical protein
VGGGALQFGKKVSLRTTSHLRWDVVKKCGKFKYEHFLPPRKKLTDFNTYSFEKCQVDSLIKCF